MSSETEEKCEKSSKPIVSLPTLVGLVLLGICAYQIGPDAIKNGKEVWMKTSCRLNPPKGHLKPLGHQFPPMENVPEVTEWPEPEVFFKEYVAGNKPVVFRGLAKTIPAFHKWTDEYLRKTFGHEEVAVEIGLKQKDYGENLYLNVLSEFLNGYTHKQIYLVDTVSPGRFADVSLPKPLRCGNFQRALSDVIMWLSNGNTKSIIHSDYVDNVNCILDGEKKLHLFERKYTDKHRKDFSRSFETDVDAIDLCEFPAYSALPRYEIVVKKGDCLFLPFQWYHHVAANSARNLGINFWFQHLNYFNETDCQVKDIGDNYHFGAENMPTSAELKQFEILTYLGSKTEMDFDSFSQSLLHEQLTDKERLTKLFNDADTDADGVVTIKEITSVEPNHFVSFFKEVGGLRFLNYTRDRGNLDPEDPNATKGVEL